MIATTAEQQKSRARNEDDQHEDVDEIDLLKNEFGQRTLKNPSHCADANLVETNTHQNRTSSRRERRIGAGGREVGNDTCPILRGTWL